MTPLPICLLKDEERLVRSPQLPDAPLKLPPFDYGDKVPIQLRAYERRASGGFAALNLSTLDVTLRLGPVNERPRTGFWTITPSGGSESAAMDVGSDAAAVQTVLRPLFGQDVTVTGEAGDFILSMATNGAVTTPAINFYGSTDVTETVTVIIAGSVHSPAQFRLELRSEAAASIAPDDWDTGTVTPASAVTDLTNGLFRVTLDAQATQGFYKLTVGGTATGFISLFAAPLDVEAAIRATGAAASNATVQYDTNGTYLVRLSTGVTLAITDTSLVIPPFITGVLNLEGPAVRELLDGAEWVPVDLSVTLEDDDDEEVTATAGAILRMPVSQVAA